MKPPAYPSVPPHPAKAKFDRSQRTNSPRDLDPCSPERTWDVGPNHLGPAVYGERAQRHEHDEGEVKDDQGVGQQKVDHRQSPFLGSSMRRASGCVPSSPVHRREKIVASVLLRSQT